MADDAHGEGKRQLRADAPDFRPSFVLAARLADECRIEPQPLHRHADGHVLDSLAIRTSVEQCHGSITKEAAASPAVAAPASGGRAIFCSGRPSLPPGFSLAKVSRRGLARTDTLQLAKKIAQAKAASAAAATSSAAQAVASARLEDAAAASSSVSALPYYLYGHEGGSSGKGKESALPPGSTSMESAHEAPLSSPVSSSSRRNALHVACLSAACSGSGELALAQLEHWYRTRPGHEWLGALDGKDEAGERPFHYAVRAGHGSVLDFLLSAGADASCKAGAAAGSVTPLHIAVACRDTASVQALLYAGADPSSRMRGGYTPLHLALAPLVHVGTQGRVEGMEGEARDACLQCVEQLVDAGSDVNAMSESSVSPMLLASLLCEQGHSNEGSALVHALVSRGAGLLPRLAHPPLGEVPPGGTPLMMKPSLYTGLELAGSKQSSAVRRGPFRVSSTGGGEAGDSSRVGPLASPISPLHLVASMGMYGAVQAMLDAGRDSTLPLPSAFHSGPAGRRRAGGDRVREPPWKYSPGQGWVRIGGAQPPSMASTYCAVTHALCTTPGQESGPVWGGSESVLHAACRGILLLAEWGGVAAVEGMGTGQGIEAVHSALGCLLAVVETVCHTAVSRGCGPSVCNSLNSCGQSPLYLLLGPPGLPVPPQVQELTRKDLLAAVQEMQLTAENVRCGQAAPVGGRMASCPPPVAQTARSPSIPHASSGAALPLTTLVQDARVVMLRLLLQAGADVHRPAWKGNSASTVASAACGTLPDSLLPLTPLGLALTHGRTECIPLLVQAGAHLTVPLCTMCGSRMQGEGGEVRASRAEEGQLPSMPHPEVPPWHSHSALQEATGLAESVPGSTGQGILALAVLQSVSFDGRLPLYATPHAGPGLGRSTTLGMGQAGRGQWPCMDAGSLHQAVRLAVLARETGTRPWSTQMLHKACMQPADLAGGCGAAAGWALLRPCIHGSEGWAGSALAESVAVQVVEDTVEAEASFLSVCVPPSCQLSTSPAPMVRIPLPRHTQEEAPQPGWLLDPHILSARCPYLSALFKGELGEGREKGEYSLIVPSRTAARCLLTYLATGELQDGERGTAEEYGREVWAAICAQVGCQGEADQTVLSIELPLSLQALLAVDVAWLASAWCVPHAARAAQDKLLQVLKAWPDCAQAMLHAAEGLQARVGEAEGAAWVYAPLLAATRQAVQEGGTGEQATWVVTRGLEDGGRTAAASGRTSRLPSPEADPSINFLAQCVTAGPEVHMALPAEVQHKYGLDSLRSMDSEARNALFESYVSAAAELLCDLLGPDHPPSALGCLPLQLAALCVLADVADIVPEQPEKALRALSRQVAAACCALPGPALALVGLPYTEAEVAKAQFAPPTLDLIPCLSLLHLARLFQYPDGSEAKLAALQLSAHRCEGSPVVPPAYTPCLLPSCLCCNNSYSSAEAREGVQATLRACAVHVRTAVHIREALCQGSDVRGSGAPGLPAGSRVWADLWQAVQRADSDRAGDSTVQLVLQVGERRAAVTLPVHRAALQSSGLMESAYTVQWPTGALSALQDHLLAASMPATQDVDGGALLVSAACLESAWADVCSTWHRMLYNQLPSLMPRAAYRTVTGAEGSMAQHVHALLLYRLLLAAPVGAWGDRVALALASRARRIAGWSSRSTTALAQSLPPLLAMKVVCVSLEEAGNRGGGTGQRLLHDSLAVSALRGFSAALLARENASSGQGATTLSSSPISVPAEMPGSAPVPSSSMPWAAATHGKTGEGPPTKAARRKELSSEDRRILLLAAQ